MALHISKFIETLVHRRNLRRWALVRDSAPGADLGTLHMSRGRASALRRLLDQVIHAADRRLALPLAGSGAIRAPMGTDWSWRPAPWQGPMACPGLALVPDKTVLSDGVTLFHDCRMPELALRQIRNAPASDTAPFGLQVEVFGFDGSFLSLVLDLPEAAAHGLRLRHLIRVDVIAETEAPLRLLVRLNIKHGPNVEQILRELPMDAPAVAVEFDLTYSRINEKRVEKLWVDLIFEKPQMNRVRLHDVTLSRRPRAEL